MMSPRIGLTLGDPGGIGPEIILRLLIQPTELPPAEIVIFGQKKILEIWTERLGLDSNWQEKATKKDKIKFQEVGEPLKEIKIGKPAAENGQMSFAFFQAAVDSARNGEIQALVTAPISKTSWQLAGIKYRGHTEFLETFFPEAIMSFWSEKLRLALFTHHVPLKEAINRVKRPAILQFLLILEKNVRRWNLGIKEYLLCGLNPHAGEAGSLGEEEIQELIPAAEEARTYGINLSGPFPPDTIFLKAIGHPEKMVVSLYHDQGLIPFKLLSFDSGVNMTLGLPFLRTSPDHGTAFDIAGKGVANPRSLKEALWLAWKAATSGNIND